MRGHAPRLVAALGVALLLLATSGCQSLPGVPPSDAIPTDARTNFHLIAEAWNTISEVYVNRAAAAPPSLAHGAIRGMVDALDDTGHSRFLTPQARTIQQQVTQGTLEGIGAEIQRVRDQIVIVAPLDESPAQRAGLKPGDVILKVHGADVAGVSLEDVVARIAGRAGTAVELSVLAPRTGVTREIRIVRSRIALRNLTWQRVPDTAIAHVRLASFSKGVAEELRRALGEIRRDGLGAMILDLRNDPGGLFDEAIDTASQFLDGGHVLLEKDASGNVTPVPTRGRPAAPSLPMVVLVNKGTASAGEIVAGALRDAARARLVGETTFGTGTILQEFPLSDGSALLLAVKEWLTPRGDVIWHRGIVPDVPVALAPEVSPLFPSAERGMTAAELRTTADRQLLRALELLERQPATAA